MDTNYARLGGTITDLQLNETTTTSATFTLDSSDTGYPISVSCLKGCGASPQLETVGQARPISMIALRNIDLGAAIDHNTYTINLLAIDIQQQP
jgi:hypothetical protein